MDWIKEHKTLAGILGAVFAGVIGLGVLLWNSYSGYGAALEEYDSTSKKLGRLESTPLYPNQDNLTAKQKMVEEYGKEVKKLQTTLLNLQPEVKDISETDFQAKLKQRITETRQKAGGANEEASRVPKNFAFGFDTYINALPTAGTAKDLNDYLDGVDSIVQLALDSGVKKIESLTRSELESEKTGAAAAAKPESTASSFVKGTTSAKGKDSKTVEAAPAAKVVERRQVQLKVVADQGPLQDLLNGLASASKMHYFTVVRVLRIENQKMDGPSKAVSAPIREESPTPTTTDGTTPGGEQPAKPAGPEVIVAPSAAQPDAVAVMGQENLHAHLEIDIIRYLASTAEASGSK